MVPILQSRKLRYEELKQLVKAFIAIKVPLDNRVSDCESECHLQGLCLQEVGRETEDPSCNLSECYNCCELHALDFRTD